MLLSLGEALKKLTGTTPSRFGRTCGCQRGGVDSRFARRLRAKDEKTTASRDMNAHVLAEISDQKDDPRLVSLMSCSSIDALNSVEQ